MAEEKHAQASLQDHATAGGVVLGVKGMGPRPELKKRLLRRLLLGDVALGMPLLKLIMVQPHRCMSLTNIIQQ